MKIKKFINNQKGVALVEFGLILPLLILLLFGIVEFGLLLFNKQVITNASREGARAGIVSRENRVFDPDDGDQVNVRQVVIDWISSNLVTFGDTGPPDIQILIANAADLSTFSGDPDDLDSVDSIDKDDRCITFKCPLAVKVTYYYDFLVLSNFWIPGTNIRFGQKKLEAVSIMKME